MTIYKYPLAITEEQRFEMPKGAKVLCVQVRNGEPYIWALVDPGAATEGRMFRMIGTGNPADGVAALPYIGSFQIHGGTLVFHVFEGRNDIG